MSRTLHAYMIAKILAFDVNTDLILDCFDSIGEIISCLIQSFSFRLSSDIRFIYQIHCIDKSLTLWESVCICCLCLASSDMYNSECDSVYLKLWSFSLNIHMLKFIFACNWYLHLHFIISYPSFCSCALSKDLLVVKFDKSILIFRGDVVYMGEKRAELW